MKLNMHLMTANSQINLKNNRIQNLFRNLQKDPRSVFYSVGNLTKSILNKANKSIYEKDKVFVNLYNQLEDKNFYQKIICLLLRCFLMKKIMLIIQHFTLVVSLLIYYMVTLHIPDFWPSLLLIQNIVFYWLIYLLLEFTIIH